MTREKIQDVMNIFAKEAKQLYGNILKEIILYGSCARGDFSDDSDIDVLILLNVPLDQISEQRDRIQDVTNRLDLDYDVVLAPVCQTLEVYERYAHVSPFYQNIKKEGVRFA